MIYATENATARMGLQQEVLTIRMAGTDMADDNEKKPVLLPIMGALIGCFVGAVVGGGVGVGLFMYVGVGTGNWFLLLSSLFLGAVLGLPVGGLVSWIVVRRGPAPKVIFACLAVIGAFVLITVMFAFIATAPGMPNRW